MSNIPCFPAVDIVFPIEAPHGSLINPAVKLRQCFHSLWVFLCKILRNKDNRIVGRKGALIVVKNFQPVKIIAGVCSIGTDCIYIFILYGFIHDTWSHRFIVFKCEPVDTSYLWAVSYTHLRAHETDSYLVCRLLLEKK